jgi:hypothetical protein
MAAVILDSLATIAPDSGGPCPIDAHGCPWRHRLRGAHGFVYGPATAVAPVALMRILGVGPAQTAGAEQHGRSA